MKTKKKTITLTIEAYAANEEEAKWLKKTLDTDADCIVKAIFKASDKNPIFYKVTEK